MGVRKVAAFISLCCIEAIQTLSSLPRISSSFYLTVSCLFRLSSDRKKLAKD